LFCFVLFCQFSVGVVASRDLSQRVHICQRKEEKRDINYLFELS